MIWRGGIPPVPRDLSVPVSLTRSGLPTIIPAFHRREMIRRSPRGDVLVRVYLSCFSLGKLILIGKRITRALFASMINPPLDMDSVKSVVSDLKIELPGLLELYTPWISSLPLHQGLEFEPTWKALPTHKLTQWVIVKRCKLAFREARKVKSCFTSFTYELASWRWLMQFAHAAWEQWSQGILWAPRVRYARDKMNSFFSGSDLDWFESRIGPSLPSPWLRLIPLMEAWPEKRQANTNPLGGWAATIYTSSHSYRSGLQMPVPLNHPTFRTRRLKNSAFSVGICTPVV